MTDDPVYWNPVLETYPLEKTRVLQLKKFNKIFQWAYDNSKFHRKLYHEAGVRPDDIRTLEDIQTIPKVDKSAMQDIQRKDPFPYGDALCVPLEEVTEYRQTSGTTGQPVYQPTPGKIGNGGQKAGPICCGRRGIGLTIAFLSPSVITYLSHSGLDITVLKR